MYNWITMLYTWNLYNIVLQLYLNLKKEKKIKNISKGMVKPKQVLKAQS